MQQGHYVELDKPMLYVPSSFFGQDLTRHLRGLYPTTIFDNPHFEVDENGSPWYIAPVYKPTIGLWGGKQVTGAIICDPCTGDAAIYSVSDLPTWVDFVFDGDLICKQYNYASQLQNGYWNSLFGQRDCRKVTEDGTNAIDYGFLAIGDDIWIYTGVTSVNGDASNIGFLLSNQRTEQTLFITQAGANEFSAMAAAEGEVQEKGYKASFPSLVRFDNEMAYLMVLKDAAGLVKMYAAVGVDQYNIVAATSVQNETVAKFQQMIRGNVGAYETDQSVRDAQSIMTSEESEQIINRKVFFADGTSHVTMSVHIERYDLVVIDNNTYVFMLALIGSSNGNDMEFAAPLDGGAILIAKYTDVPTIVGYDADDEVSIITDGNYFVFAS